MKRMNRRSKTVRVVGLLLCLLLLASMLPSFGALGATKSKKKTNSSGSLEVKLEKSIFDRLPKDAKVEFTLYQIGKASPDVAAGWEIDSEFSRYKILEARTSEDLGKAAAALANDIVGKYKGNTQYLSEKGVAVFSGLASGVYLGVMTQSPEGLSVAPFIVTLPSKDPETQALRYSYPVTVKGSYVESTPTPSVTPTVTPTITPTVTPTVTPTITPTVTPTITPTVTPTVTPTITPTVTPTVTPTITPTETPTVTPTPRITPTPVPRITPTPEPRISIPVLKVWDDADGAAGKRPDSITVRLLADGATVREVELNEGNNWFYNFRDLPEYNGDGSKIVYTVEEDAVPDYQKPVITGSMSEGFTITNPYRQTPEYEDFVIIKTWQHNGNNPARYPESVTMYMLRDDGLESERVTVDYSDEMRIVFKHLEVVDQYGNKHTWTPIEVREDGSIKAYVPSAPDYSDYDEGIIRIQNIYIGSTPPTPTDDDDSPTPTPTGTTPNTPQRPEDIPDRTTGTPVPPFEDKSDEELEDLFDIFGYSTPLYGMLGTGDYIPVWVWVCSGAGVLAIILIIVTGRKKKKRQ